MWMVEVARLITVLPLEFWVVLGTCSSGVAHYVYRP